MHICYYVSRQKLFSEHTFGPGTREKGIIDHIRKELKEIEEAETPEEKQREWIDAIILAIDGAWRSGMSGEEIERALHEKYGINLRRRWPDWRGMSQDVAIEHDRSAG